MAKPLFEIDQVHFAALAELCPVVAGAVVSKPLTNTSAIKQILFSMDAGQEISEHHAPFAATVHVLSGRLQFEADGQRRSMSTDDWVVMPPDAPHALSAEKPTRFMLTMWKESGE